MKTAIKIELILLITLFFTFSVYGATIGTAVLLKGQMKVESQDKYQLFDEPNATLEVSDTDKIHTGAGTRVRIVLRDKKEVIHLYATSLLSMDKVSEDQSDLSLLIGKARFVVQPAVSKLTNLRRKFQVRTGNAFIGVRGTDFVTQTDGVSTSVLTVEGVVAIANLTAPDVAVEVGAGQASKTSGDAPPAPAVDIPAEAIEKITTEDAATEWEGVEFEETAAAGETQTEEAETTTEEPVEETSPLDAAGEAQSQTEAATDTVKQTTTGASTKSIKFKVTEN